MIVAYFAIKPILRFSNLNSLYLAPLLISFVLLGAFAIRNSVADVVFVIGFGLLGWAFKHAEWPRAPLLLGLVLGGMAESKFFLSLSLYGWQWILRPGVLLIFLLMLWVVFRQVRLRAKNHYDANA